MKINSFLIFAILATPVAGFSQLQVGVWRTPTDNTAYHHFTRDGAGAAVYINQVQENSSHPILRLSSGSSEANENVKITFESNGNVGVGTINPGSKLHVVGRGRFGGNAVFIDWTHEENWNGLSEKWSGYIGFNAFRDNNDPKDFFKGVNKYTDKAVIEGSNKGFRFLFRNTSNNDSDEQHILSEIVRFTDGGHVGIGITNPTHKLTVDGVISAREVKVSNTPNSDYVFEPDYPLLPLSEVETHIKEKKHLPGIPSAEEFKQNGVGLGEMDDMLLRKVEELVLYTIEQQKELERLRKENEALRKEKTADIHRLLKRIELLETRQQ